MPETIQPEKKIQKIVQLLKNGHQSLTRKKKLAAAGISVSVFLVCLSLLIFIESSAFLPGLAKVLALFVILILAILAGIFASNYDKIPRFSTFYERFFLSFNRKNTLNAVDLYLDEKQKKSRFYSAAISANLASADIDTLSGELKEHIRSTNTHKLYRAGISGCLAAVLLSFLVFSALTDEMARTLHFWESYTQPNPYAYSITPSDTTIEHGTALQVAIRFSGSATPENVILEFKTDVEDTYRQRQMQPAGNNTFLSPEIDLINNVSYHIEMDGYLSEEYHVDVQLQPRFDELTAIVNPPGYTGLAENRFDYPFSQINLYPGSTLTFTGITNKNVTNIQITGSSFESEMEREEENERVFSTVLAPQQSDTIRFSMSDHDGFSNRNPFRTVINLREDQYPAVVIHEPTGTVMKTDPSHVDIFYQATDDFGLTRAQLTWHHQRAFVEELQSGTMALDRPRNGRTEEIRWNLEEFELRPRDQLIFSIRVWDNDEVSGYKMSESQQVVIQVPSLSEYFEDLDSQERDMQNELDQISESFETMENDYQEFLERMKENPEGGFEEQQLLEDIQERQQTVDDAVKELNEKFREMRSELEGNDRISDETRRAYQELQQLMEELDDPALMEAIEELRRALENINSQDLERALENVSFNEQLYKERIERTVELFKRLKMNSDLDKLARQYDDLAERVLQDMDAAPDQFSREMETVMQDLNNVSEQLEQLDSNPPRRSEETLRQLKEDGQRELENIREQLESLQNQAGNGSEAEDRSEGNGEAGENGEGDGEEGENGSPSEQSQQEQISQQMQQEAERFRSSIQQMSGQQLNVNILALQRALYTLLEISNMQEYVTQTAVETRNRSHGFVDLARIQNNLSDQFSHVADTLFQVSAEIPGVPNQINRKKLEVEQRLNRTIDQMVERNQRGSSIATRETLGGINDLTSMIASLIDQLMNQQNGGGGGGMSMQQMVEQLQNMSGDQQQLNQQLQDLINDMQGDRLTREQSERLDQIARQQNEIRQQMQDLQQSGALDQGDRMLSELQRMIEDMEDSINEMRGGVTDPLMVERQQNILSRMLNAEESLQQRGEDEEREGATPTQYDRVLPPDITLEELQQEIRSRMQDPNYTRFSEKYQRLIERYFEQLQRIEEQVIP